MFYLTYTSFHLRYTFSSAALGSGFEKIGNFFLTDIYNLWMISHI